MSFQCDFCHKDLSLDDGITLKSYTCTCGKLTCSQECHNYQIGVLRKNNVYEIFLVCYDEILKNGVKGKLLYDFHNNDYANIQQIIIDDPTYQPMLEELEQLRATVKKLTQQNEEISV
jgi:hypothetical protein